MGPQELPVEGLPPRYPVTGLGALAGGIAGGTTGLALAAAFTDGPADAARSSFAVLGLVFLLLGSGATAGVWLGLRASGDRVPGRTTFMAAAGFLAWSVVSLPSLFWALDVLPPDGLPKTAGLAGLAAMLTVPPAIGARWIIVANEKLEREES